MPKRLRKPANNVASAVASLSAAMRALDEARRRYEEALARMARIASEASGGSPAPMERPGLDEPQQIDVDDIDHRLVKHLRSPDITTEDAIIAILALRGPMRGREIRDLLDAHGFTRAYDSVRFSLRELIGKPAPEVEWKERGLYDATAPTKKRIVSILERSDAKV